MLPRAKTILRAGSRSCSGVGHAGSHDLPCPCTGLRSLEDGKATLFSRAFAPNITLGKEKVGEQSQMRLLGPWRLEIGITGL